MTTHTPGPFIQLEANETARAAPCGCVLRHTDACPSVTLCPMHAAAPDLLAACTRLVQLSGRLPVEHLSHFADSYDRARAAIDKAQGGAARKDERMRITLTQYGSAGPMEIDPSAIAAITPLEAYQDSNGDECQKRTRIDGKHGQQWLVQETLAQIRAYINEATGNSADEGITDQ